MIENLETCSKEDTRTILIFYKGIIESALDKLDSMEEFNASDFTKEVYKITREQLIKIPN